MRQPTNKPEREALKAIGTLFSDESISDEETRASLENIKSEVEVYLAECPRKSDAHLKPKAASK